MADEISLEITETITKVEVTEDVTSINITPNITSVELKGISISNAGSATAMSYAGESNTLGYGSTVAASLDHINTNGLNKNLDQTIDGNITFADGHTITFPTSGYTALELNDNSMNVAGITASADITSATKMEAPLFKGDLEGAVHFKASGSGLAKGDVVYISGYQGNKTTVDKADASDSAKMPAFGIVNATQGGNVDILTFGSMLHLSTTGIATGTELYVSASTAGGYETSAPTGEGNLVQKIAKVVRGDSNSGSIKIMGAGRTNATPNLNSGNIFLGNASNISTTASFDTTFASSFATRTTTDLTEGDNEYYTNAKADARVDLQTGSNLDLSQKTTTELAEGDNEYYTSAKVDARVNSVLGSGVDNIVTTGYLRGPSTFTIDPAGHNDNTGLVRIKGNLQVDGTTTTINSTTVSMDDKNLLLAAAAGTPNEANSAGIQISGAGLSMLYSSGLDALVLNKNFRAQGSFHPASLKDTSGSLGTAGQALLSTGTGIDWGNISVLTDISVNTAAAGTSALTYNNTNGIFTYTPPDLSSFITAAPVTSVNGATGDVTTLQLGTSDTTALAGNSGLSALSNVDATTNVADGKILKYNGTDSEWQVADDGAPVTSVDGTTGDITTLQLGTSDTTALAGNSATGDLSDVDGTIANANNNILAYKSASSKYEPENVNNLVDDVEEQYLTVIAGQALTKGKVCSITGVSNGVPVVQGTDADNLNNAAVGICTETVATSGTTKLLTKGILTNINTTTTAMPGSDNRLYVSTAAGTMTRTPVIGHQQNCQQVAQVLTTNATTGSILVDIDASQVTGTQLASGEIGFGGVNGEQKALYNDVSLPLRSKFGVAGSTDYVDILNAVDSSGNNLAQNSSADIGILNIGERGSSFIDEINIYPGATGKTILHYGSENNPTNSSLQESQRLHTTSKGIHVGNNLSDGSYTAGDMHVNNDTGYGVVAGQGITNAGHNCFLVGQQHNISGNSANILAVGYDIDTTNYTHQSLGVGTNIDFTGGNTLSAQHRGMFAIGRYAKVSDSYAVALGLGASNTAPILASGLASFAQGREAQATGNYSFAQGVVSQNGSNWVKPTASAPSSVVFGPSTNAGDHSFVAGKFNTINNTADNAGILGSYNTVSGNGSMVFGEGNITQNAAGSLKQVAIGTSHELYGDSSIALGKGCFTPTAIANIAAGYSVKAPQRNISGFPAQGNGQVVVGAFNDNLKEWASDDYANDIVAPLHFSVGTGSADGSRYTSMAIGPKSPSANPNMGSATGESGFCGIIMQALADSSSYTDAEASHADSHVPVGGLYRTGNIVKIRLA